jgi:hypothetical protein
MAELAQREQVDAPRFASAPDSNFAEMIDSLIVQVQACERAFGVAAGGEIHAPLEDVVFVDDFAACIDFCQPDAEALLIPRSVDLAGRYSAMLKAALHVLLQIRELHSRSKP